VEVKLDRHKRFADQQPVSEVLHSCQDMRVILFHLQPGQAIEPHTSESSVSLHVIEGQGELLAGGDWAPAGAGTIRFYPPGEPHGVRATDSTLAVLATLAPRL
jgi:quercetin dioxygenase-like cupin family protein